MQIEKMLEMAIKMGGSDLFLIPGSSMQLKIKGRMTKLTDERIMPEGSEDFVRQIYGIAGRNIDKLLKTGDDDFSFSIPGVGRFSCSAYRQRNSLAAVIRIINFGLPRSEDLHIPEEVMSLSQTKSGLILVTGPAGSGKTTTQACLIDRINSEREGHIITLEDPIEHIHRHKKCLVSQREIGHDTDSYSHALRSAVRQTPDVILLGEMRDFDTIQTVLTAGETGQLIITTMHNVGAVNSIPRIVDGFPLDQQGQIRLQLSMVLRAVVSQQLIPTKSGVMKPVFEVLMVNPTVQSMIREGKIHELDKAMGIGKDGGLKTMDTDIKRLYDEGEITKETALAYAVDYETMERELLNA